MSLYEKILNKEESISLVGLGYVGLPIAIAFAKSTSVIGFDISESKIDLYKKGIDPTKEVGNDAVRDTNVVFTSNEKDLRNAKFHIVAVPTPITEDKIPDLRPLRSATKTVAENLTRGSIVVFESTVYPGVTEEICIPILEEFSGLIFGVDFKVGFSPERINPGDTVNKLETIVKVVSGSDEEALDEIAKVYEIVVEAGVHRATTIKVAEAAKVIENAQRDINIAFMNELSIIFNKIGINTQDVLKAAGTKWNFLNFTPGLVGGHCIGVDPYYLTYKANQIGYHPRVILSGRDINDNMGKYVTENIIKQLIKADLNVKKAKIAILGFTFKENVPDIRNTRVMDIVNELKEYNIVPLIIDPEADQLDAEQEYGIKFTDIDDVKDVDAVVLAVNHDVFKSMSFDSFEKLFKQTNNENKVIIDIKSLLNKKIVSKKGYNYFSL